MKCLFNFKASYTISVSWLLGPHEIPRVVTNMLRTKRGKEFPVSSTLLSLPENCPVREMSWLCRWTRLLRNVPLQNEYLATRGSPSTDCNTSTTTTWSRKVWSNPKTKRKWRRSCSNWSSTTRSTDSSTGRPTTSRTTAHWCQKRPRKECTESCMATRKSSRRRHCFRWMNAASCWRWFPSRTGHVRVEFADVCCFFEFSGDFSSRRGTKCLCSWNGHPRSEIRGAWGVLHPFKLGD